MLGTGKKKGESWIRREGQRRRRTGRGGWQNYHQKEKGFK